MDYNKTKFAIGKGIQFYQFVMENSCEFVECGVKPCMHTTVTIILILCTSTRVNSIYPNYMGSNVCQLAYTVCPIISLLCSHYASIIHYAQLTLLYSKLC